MPEVIIADPSWIKAWDQTETVLLSLACYRFDLREGARFTSDGEGFQFASLDVAPNEARSRKLIHRRWDE
jgi:hypothetical protein